MSGTIMTGYVYIDSDLIKGWHKCEDKEFFANHDPYKDEFKGNELKWIGKPIDKENMAKVLALVSHFPRTEVMFCLYYSKTDGKWLVHLPKQKGTPAHVTYSDEDYDPPKGYYFTGTIHTHPNMSAFWSGTDTGDQTKKTGLHVVLGLTDGKYKEHLCSIFYNGKRYDQEGCVELPEGELPEVDKEWLDRVEEEFPEPKVETKPVYRNFADYYDHWKQVNDWKGFDRDCSSFDIDRYYDEEVLSADDVEEALDQIKVNLTREAQLKIINDWLWELSENELAEKLGETIAEERKDGTIEDVEYISPLSDLEEGYDLEAYKEVEQ